MSETSFALFDTSGEKDTGASDATNGMMALILANLAAGVDVDGSDHIVHYDSRTGLADPAGGIHEWAYPDRVIDGKYALPLPPASMIGDYNAILDGLDGLTAPPTGGKWAIEAPATPDDPMWQMGISGASYYGYEQLYLNKAHYLDAWAASNSKTVNAMISDSEIDGTTGAFLQMPAGASDTAGIIFAAFDGTAEAKAAMNGEEFTLRWTGAGTVSFHLGAWTNIATGANSATADLNTAGSGYLRWTAAPVSGVSAVRSAYLDIFDAGLEFDPNTLDFYRQARTIRNLDPIGTNGSAIDTIDAIAPRSFISWAMFNPTNYPYRGQPLEVFLELCNLCRADAWLCVLEELPPSEINRMLDAVEADLAADKAVYIENSNECWNFASAYTAFAKFNAAGIDLFNKATIDTAGTGYTVGDEVLGVETVTITNITRANPAIVTYSGAQTVKNGADIVITGVGGMTEVNGNTYRVASIDTGAKTFKLTTTGNVDIDSSAFTAYTSGGTAAHTAWTVTIDTVSSGVPATFTVTGRQNPFDYSAVAMSGGTGSGLVLDFTVYASADTDFPTYHYYGFRVAQIIEQAKIAFGSVDGTRARAVLGVQSRNPGITPNMIAGYNARINGMPGHPDFATGSGGAWADIWAWTGTNYVGPSPTTQKTAAEAALAGGQAAFEAWLSSASDVELAENIGFLQSHASQFDAVGVTRAIAYEGGEHKNVSPADTALVEATRVYLTSATGIAQRSASFEAYKAIFGAGQSQLACIGTRSRGDPWFLSTYPQDQDDPVYQLFKAQNAANKGSTYDPGRTGGFGCGRIRGLLDHDGSIGGDTSNLIVGGPAAVMQGDETNVGILADEGVATNFNQVLISGTQAGNGAATAGPNGCVQLRQSGQAFGTRLHPTKVNHVRFEGSWAKVAVSAL